jgi:hypothetical protein
MLQSSKATFLNRDLADIYQILLTIASRCSKVCGKTGGDKDNEFYCMT